MIMQENYYADDDDISERQQRPFLSHARGLALSNQTNPGLLFTTRASFSQPNTSCFPAHEENPLTQKDPYVERVYVVYDEMAVHDV